jgi:hypothetical protein
VNSRGPKTVSLECRDPSLLVEQDHDDLLLQNQLLSYLFSTFLFSFLFFFFSCFHLSPSSLSQQLLQQNCTVDLLRGAHT